MVSVILISALIIGTIINWPIVSSSTYIGCYADLYPTSRAMPDASTNSTLNTPAKCESYCTSLGLAYSGTENGNECHCSEAAPTIVSNACIMLCAGDFTKICGGINALSVVYTSIPQLPATNSTKRGLCWSWNNNASTLALFSPSNIPWLYNWELWDPRPPGIYSEAEYVPMCRTETDAPKIFRYLSECKHRKLLGFNEPDLPEVKGGYYISPYNASILWKQYIQPMKSLCNMALGAPAVTSSTTAGMGIDWLQQFFGNCSFPECSFDFIPLHWYGKSWPNFQKHLTKFHENFPAYPLWITEWQFTGFTSVVTANLEKQALQWLDAQSYVARYSMFAPKEAGRMNGKPSGAMITDDLRGLTNVGKIYAGQM